MCMTVSHTYWLVFLQGVQYQPRYLTEELQKIFTEDTDSETEAFEGFASSEVDVKKEGVLVKTVCIYIFLFLPCKLHVPVSVFLIDCDVPYSYRGKIRIILKK